MRKFGLILALFLILTACVKKEIPTGVPSGPGPSVVPETQVKPPVLKGEGEAQEGPAVRPPTFREEEVVTKEEGLSEEGLSEEERLAVYGRSTPPLKAIFFDFDSYEIRDDMKPRLQENARYILDHPEIMVELQGNCDERGSSEYNLALGEKRALMVKQYFVNLGIDPARLTTVSFGEEKPLAQGHDEEAWALNRRVDLVIVAE